MLLIFGFSMATDLIGTPTQACGRCGHHGEHELTRSQRRLTLFFVPVWRVGAGRYELMCPRCGLVTRLTPDEAQRLGRAPAAAGPQDAPTWTPQDR
jgi:ribosomal protein S27AE